MPPWAVPNPRVRRASLIRCAARRGPQEYYSSAIEIFESKCQISRLSWLIYGDITQKRIDFINSRLAAIAKEETPLKGKFLDSSGNEQQLGRDGAPVADDSGYLSYANPFSWYRWYYSEPAGAEAPSSEPPAGEAA